MRLIWKIMLSTMTVLIIGLSVCGYFLISQGFRNSIERETRKSLQEYSLLKYSLQSSLMNESRLEEISDKVLYQLALQTASLTSDMNTAVYGEDGKCIFSNLPEEYIFYESGISGNGENGYIIKKIGSRSLIEITGLIEQGNVKIHLYTVTDATEVVREMEKQKKDFLTIYIILILSGTVVTLLLSLLLTKPIDKLTKVSQHIADGNFSERVNYISQDEIGALSKSFNKMADVLEEKISILELEMQKREEFISDFSHELKTPLTAVIGYADMLYSKDFDRSNQKKAANFILNEGLRLEALSKKLMELIILDKHDFVLEQINAKDMLKDVLETLEPEMQKRNILLTVQGEAGIIRIECDLMKTMLMNLIDNAIKADAKHIHISGKCEESGYTVCVRDDGRGIPASELSRITEAFYMVDKSRSRKQYGAGLGLAICSKIAKLHYTNLQFVSEVDKGTEVCFSLLISGDAGYV